MKSIRVMIVDDHQIFIDGMKALLMQAEGLELAGGATSADECVKQAVVLKPDVVLMDIQMPGKDGITATRDLLKQLPKVKVLALTSANESFYIKKMLEAGASGYVVKNIDRDALIAVIKKVYAGEKYLDPSVSLELLNNFGSRSAAPVSPVNKLTTREKEILVLIARGLTDKEIAAQVFLSAETVITHRKNILSKLGLKNKVELARFAMENKLL